MAKKDVITFFNPGRTTFSFGADLVNVAWIEILKSKKEKNGQLKTCKKIFSLLKFVKKIVYMTLNISYHDKLKSKNKKRTFKYGLKAYLTIFRFFLKLIF